jgi:hypothetical protein
MKEREAIDSFKRAIEQMEPRPTRDIIRGPSTASTPFLPRFL